MPRLRIKSTDEPPTSGKCPCCGELIFYPGWICFNCCRVYVRLGFEEDDEPDGEGDELDRGEKDETEPDEWDVILDIDDGG